MNNRYSGGLQASGRPVDYQDVPIENGEPFWPDLNLAEFQRQRSLPVNIPADVLLLAVLTSVKEVNDALASAVSIYRGKGHAAAYDVPGTRAGGENELTAQYKKAVYSRAKADLMGEFQTIGRRETSPGQESNETRETLLAESALVLRNMLGFGRIGVHKI